MVLFYSHTFHSSSFPDWFFKHKVEIGLFVILLSVKYSKVYVLPVGTQDKGKWMFAVTHMLKDNRKLDGYFEVMIKRIEHTFL